MGASLRIILAASLCLVVTTAQAETRTVEVSASVSGTGRTPEQARREALQRARDEAVALAAGVHVTAQQLRLRSEEMDGTVRDGFSSLVETSAAGRIVKEQVTYRTRLENEIPVYDVALAAVVEIEEGARDPGFTLDLATETGVRTLRDGEPLTLEVTASRRCYLTLIHIGSDGALELLVPSSLAPEMAVEAGRKMRVPTRASGFLIRARLSQGQEREREGLLAVATLDPVPLTLPSGEGGFIALNRWLLRIPIARRAQALWEYEISR
ncbi:MAG TPA: DUF4384 domain-containing protein [Candidatus Polarisedimenticolaceae bacterium]|nr:DUF4384 domain-containing protein [Candidatus Polarisedimenticolaceae bacterium]